MLNTGTLTAAAGRALLRDWTPDHTEDPDFAAYTGPDYPKQDYPPGSMHDFIPLRKKTWTLIKAAGQSGYPVDPDLIRWSMNPENVYHGHLVAASVAPADLNRSLRRRMQERPVTRTNALGWMEEFMRDPEIHVFSRRARENVSLRPQAYYALIQSMRFRGEELSSYRVMMILEDRDCPRLEPHHLLPVRETLPPWPDSAQTEITRAQSRVRRRLEEARVQGVHIPDSLIRWSLSPDYVWHARIVLERAHVEEIPFRLDMKRRSNPVSRSEAWTFLHQLIREYRLETDGVLAQIRTYPHYYRQMINPDNDLVSRESLDAVFKNHI